MFDWLTISSRQPIAGVVFCRLFLINTDGLAVKRNGEFDRIGGKFSSFMENGPAQLRETWAAGGGLQKDR